MVSGVCDTLCNGILSRILWGFQSMLQLDMYDISHVVSTVPPES
jgi:hypothetical protein